MPTRRCPTLDDLKREIVSGPFGDPIRLATDLVIGDNFAEDAQAEVVEADGSPVHGGTDAVVVGQIRKALGGVSAEQIARIPVEYEPVWAIGTGRNANPEDAGAVCELIRQTAAGAVREEDMAGLRTVNGGSVNPGNIKGFMGKRQNDGALVGGASSNRIISWPYPVTGLDGRTLCSFMASSDTANH